MIEPCPNCGKAPRLHKPARYYFQCNCNEKYAIVSGPFCATIEKAEAGWNAMVRRMRGEHAPVTLESRPAVAYPERIRALRKKLAEEKVERRKDAVSLNTQRIRAVKAEAQLEERLERINALLLELSAARDERDRAEAKLAELRAAIADANSRLSAAILADETFPNEPIAESEPRQNWAEVKDLPVGTRLVSDEIAASYPGVYVEKLSYGGWEISGGKQWDHVEPEDHHNWRPYPGMTWDQLNAVAKHGDRATCGALGDERYITKNDHIWTLQGISAFRWRDQTDWRLL